MGSQTMIKNIGIGVAVAVVLGGAYLFLVKDTKQESPLLTKEGVPADVAAGGSGAQTTYTGESSEARDIAVVLNQLKAVSINGEIFDNPAFRALTDFHLNASPEPKGRQNPFLPGEGVRTGQGGR